MVRKFLGAALLCWTAAFCNDCEMAEELEEIGSCCAWDQEWLRTRQEECHGWYQWGELMPDQAPLWQHFAADPRQITFGAAWRFNDNALSIHNVIPVSFDGFFDMYRWHNVWPWGGDLDIGLEGCVWAVFDPLHDSSPLIDADYYVGVPIVYAFDRWSFRLRGYHISTHLGDEFLLNHPGYDRRNPSAEYVDFFISKYFGEQIRLYSGIGYILHQDESFVNKRYFSALGMEVRVPQLGFCNYRNRLYGQPFLAVHLRGSGNFRNHIDSTFALGYEFGKFCGIQRRARFFIEYHDGYSVDGQFSHCPTNYFAIRCTYGF